MKRPNRERINQASLPARSEAVRSKGASGYYEPTPPVKALASVLSSCVGGLWG